MNLQTHHMQRISQQLTYGSNTIEKVWAGAYEFVTTNGQQTKHTYLTGIANWCQMIYWQENLFKILKKLEKPKIVQDEIYWMDIY